MPPPCSSEPSFTRVANPFVSSTRTGPNPTRHTGRVVEASTRYAVVDGTHIAYQVIGEGPFDLLHVPGFVSNVELAWEQPSFAHFLERLASFSRLIIFDKRGTGMSDRVPSDRLPTLEERMDDIRAVLDAVGSERVALFSHSEGGNLSILFAATYPERTIALVTAGIFAARVWSPEYPWAPRPTGGPAISNSSSGTGAAQAGLSTSYRAVLTTRRSSGSWPPTFAGVRPRGRLPH